MTDRLVAGAVYLAAVVMVAVGIGAALLAMFFVVILSFDMNSSGRSSEWWVDISVACVLAFLPLAGCALAAVRYANRRSARAAVPVAVSGLLLGLLAVPAGRVGAFHSQSSGPVWMVLTAAAAAILTLGVILPAVYWPWGTPRPLSAALR